VKTYVFRVELQAEADGRWSATCPVLPGCATWGHTREQAMHNIDEAVSAYVEDLVRAGEPLPLAAHVVEAAAVSVTV